MRWLLPLLIVACTDPGAAPPEVDERRACAEGALDHPQALRFMGDALVVASTGYGTPWRAGALAFIDVEAGRVQRVVPTAWDNPQALAEHDGRLLVVETGAYDFSADLPTMASAGGLEIVDPETGASETFELPTDVGHRAGGAVDVVVVGQHAFFSSGIAARVYLFDLATRRWLRGADDPIGYAGEGLGLGALATDGARIYLVDYNADRLHVLDGETGEPWPCSVELGSSAMLEGAKAPVVVGDALYFLLDQAGLVRRLALSSLDAGDCGAAVVETVAITGQVPNQLAVRGDRLYVVQSGENNVVVLDLETFDTVDRVILPPGSNPWDVAFHPDRPLMAVTEWQAGAVTLVDLDDGAQTRLRCGDEVPAADAGVPRPWRPRGEGRLADEVRSAPSADERRFGDPARAVNGVRGGGAGRGGQDVFSLGTTPGDDHLELCWRGGPVLDGPGTDFVVFENPFRVEGDRWFVDPVIVEVSADGEAWFAFPHDYLAPDETEYSGDPAAWLGFAGRSPVFLHEEDNPIDPLDPAAGGDRFDLADLPVDAEPRTVGARCVRLTSAQARTNPDTGAPYPADPVADGADIDGVYARPAE